MYLAFLPLRSALWGVIILMRRCSCAHVASHIRCACRFLFLANVRLQAGLFCLLYSRSSRPRRAATRHGCFKLRCTRSVAELKPALCANTALKLVFRANTALTLVPTHRIYALHF
ncbi:hypothetical protein B0H16DRAFT_970544 [Mycena metata]|uniref:Uncharacterized protein n=1 Tax=Mycena metata TaxID=1033252 RepID=A0AAD7N4X7_9AGAR|nr:hypothetical protein B0H16DRAFT_970544 [Mycena metata]